MKITDTSDKNRVRMSGLRFRLPCSELSDPPHTHPARVTSLLRVSFFPSARWGWSFYLPLGAMLIQRDQKRERRHKQKQTTERRGGNRTNASWGVDDARPRRPGDSLHPTSRDTAKAGLAAHSKWHPAWFPWRVQRTEAPCPPSVTMLPLE